MKTIETQKVEKPIEERFDTALHTISRYCVENKLIVNGNEISDPEYFVKIYSREYFLKSLGYISLNRRKKVKNCLKRIENKISLKSINLFLHFLGTKMEYNGILIFEKIKVHVKESKLQTEVDILRERYKIEFLEPFKKLFSSTEEMRKLYKLKKKELYKNNL
jgi:hypothetical protein